MVKKSLPESEPPRRVLRLICLPCPVQDATIRDLHSELTSLPGTTAVFLSTSGIIINATFILPECNFSDCPYMENQSYIEILQKYNNKIVWGK